jgi:hypothetical protein
MAAAGLWSTPTDLARFIIALQRALQGDDVGGLLASAAEHMICATVNDAYGLGLELSRSGYFSHGGANAGYTCLFIGHRTAGCGAVIMANSEHGPSLFPEILAAIAAEYEWPDYFTHGNDR